MREMEELNATELYTHLKKTSTKRTILDVREPWEYQIACLPESLNIPMSEMFTRLTELDSQSEIIVICHHGIRSRAIAKLLEQQGFENVINLSGGIDSWSRTVDPDIPTD